MDISKMQIFQPKYDSNNREFMLVTSVDNPLYVCYCEIFIHPGDDYVTIKRTSMDTESFAGLYRPIAPEQRAIAVEGFIKGQRLVVERIRKELDEEESHLATFQYLLEK